MKSCGHDEMCECPVVMEPLKDGSSQGQHPLGIILPRGFILDETNTPRPCDHRWATTESIGTHSGGVTVKMEKTACVNCGFEEVKIAGIDKNPIKSAFEPFKQPSKREQVQALLDDFARRER